MKLYNPFKPHVVEFEDGTFAVRKFSLIDFGFVYRDATKGKLDHWWRCQSDFHYAKMSSYSQALKLYWELGSIVNPNKVKRVLHG